MIGESLLINTSLKDNDLRNEKCNKQVLHISPSYMMVTDALTQFLKKKNWTKLLLISGTNERDKQFASSIKISAKKFLGQKYPLNPSMNVNMLKKIIK